MVRRPEAVVVEPVFEALGHTGVLRRAVLQWRTDQRGVEVPFE